MDNKLIDRTRNFVEAECRKPTSKYGYWPFIEHFIPMVKHAKMLATKLGGNIEIITLAAWLYDIGSIVHGQKDHHITSTKIAKEFLKKRITTKKKQTWRYSASKIIAGRLIMLGRH